MLSITPEYTPLLGTSATAGASDVARTMPVTAHTIAIRRMNPSPSADNWSGSLPHVPPSRAIRRSALPSRWGRSGAAQQEPVRVRRRVVDRADVVVDVEPRRTEGPRPHRLELDDQTRAVPDRCVRRQHEALGGGLSGMRGARVPSGPGRPPPPAGRPGPPRPR